MMNVVLRTPASLACDYDVAAPQRLVPVGQALDEILDSVTPVSGSITLPVTQARGRTAAAPIASAVALPRFDNSAMDGYGIHGDDISSEWPLRLRMTGRVTAGRSQIAALGAGTTVQILTGAPVPHGVAAIVPHEQTRQDRTDVVIDAPVLAGANIRWAGEDVAVAQQLVSAGTRIDARHIALLLATGIFEIRVKSQVRMSLLSTSDELVEAGQSLGDHNIVDTNRPFLLNLLDSPNIELRDCGIVVDRIDDVSERIRQAATDADLLVTTGGICGSDADHIAPAICAAGGTCRQIKLALRPGKPIGIGRIGATHIICLPGNPISALLTAVLFVRPLLRALAGLPRRPLGGVPAFAADVFRHAPGCTEFVPVSIAATDAAGHCRLKCLARGSHRLSSLVIADGFAEIMRYSSDILPGEPLIFHSFAADFSV